MSDINKTLSWMQKRQGKVAYNMTNRLGPSSYDCSSAVYLSLIDGGFLPSGMMKKYRKPIQSFGKSRMGANKSRFKR